MVQRIYKCLLPALLCIGVESCSSDSLQGTVDAGSLSISVETDSRAVIAGKDGSIVDTGYLPADGTVSLTLFSSVGGSSHTWEDIGDFPQGEYYFAGSYSLEARSGDTMIEGFDTPAFYGEKTVQVVKDKDTQAVVKLSLANSLVKVVYTDAAKSAFRSLSALVHTIGGVYHTCLIDEDRYLCLKPGKTELSLDVQLTDGSRIVFPAYTLQS
ncbi:DUF4493 domain-containing protein, partial [uncultured Duncaniella sp.]